MPLKIISHSKTVTEFALNSGWHVGARYTNHRDIKTINKVALIDINWKKYNLKKHLSMVKKVRPFYTVAKDITSLEELPKVIRQARLLSKYVEYIIFVPKINGAINIISNKYEGRYILGYSVPSKYGKTEVNIREFNGHPVHLLGGRPDTQRQLANQLNVVSIDGNRLTLDAGFGDYFDLETFRPHPNGGYTNCIKDSIKNINFIWSDYKIESSENVVKKRFTIWQKQMI